MVSVEVGGPHESSDGREEMISERDIGAMIATAMGVTNAEVRALSSPTWIIFEMCGSSGARTPLPMFRTRDGLHSALTALWWTEKTDNVLFDLRHSPRVIRRVSWL